MTALTFPSNPTTGDTYIGPNNTLYTYDGIKWVVTTTTTTSQDVSNFVQDASASLLVNSTQNGLVVNYNPSTNELSLTVDIDGGDATSVF